MSIIHTEIKKQLVEVYKYRIEMHAHTSPVSTCSQISPEEMAKTYKNLGYDAIVITNHFMKDYSVMHGLGAEEAVDAYLSGYEETKKAAEKYGLKVLLGTEIRFTENINDYLIYGVDRDMLIKAFGMFDKGLKEFRNLMDLSGSVFVHAHPFRDGMADADPSLLDGIEVYNMHPGQNSRVGIAAKYYRDNNMKIMTIGSDYHHPGQGHEGVSALRTKKLPEDSFELAAILKSGDYVMEIGNTVILP